MGVGATCPRCGRSLPRSRCLVCGFRATGSTAAAAPVAGDARAPRPTTATAATPSAAAGGRTRPSAQTTTSTAAPPSAGDPRRGPRPPQAAAGPVPRTRPPFDGAVVFVGDRRTLTRSAAAADSLSQLGAGLAGAVPRAFGLALGIMLAPLRILAGLSLRTEGLDACFRAWSSKAPADSDLGSASRLDASSYIARCDMCDEMCGVRVPAQLRLAAMPRTGLRALTVSTRREGFPPSNLPSPGTPTCS